MDNLPELLQTLNLTETKITKIINEFKNMKPESMTINDVNKLSHMIGITPKKLVKIMTKGLQTENNKPKISNKIGRNEKCPCNSGKKYKNCCLNNSFKNTKTNNTQEKNKHDEELCPCDSGLPMFACCPIQTENDLDKEIEKELDELNFSKNN